MIPRDYITEWRAHAPWADDAQVEQDLVISRALVELFSDPILHDRLAFRGGTALHKLFLQPPARYSEDIDLVQVRPAPIGEDLGRIRGILGKWLQEGRWKQTGSGVTRTWQSSRRAPAAPSAAVPTRLGHTSAHRKPRPTASLPGAQAVSPAHSPCRQMCR